MQAGAGHGVAAAEAVGLVLMVLSGASAAAAAAPPVPVDLSRQQCSDLRTNTCFRKAKVLKQITPFGASDESCCGLCQNDTACGAWTHNHARDICFLHPIHGSSVV
eukprot:SAG22_NODE_3993_length_1434_cov_1.182022_2_plen_105_part_01